MDGSDYSEESGDDDDADANEKTGSKPVPKSKSTLGKRKAEFGSRKPKRAYAALSILSNFGVISDSQVDLV